MRLQIPIKITPGFFITAAIIGLISGGGSLINTAIWMVVILISVLVHEFGHAIAFLFFGGQPRIELIAFGGMTIPEGKRVKGWREFIVVAMGPLFGFFLFVGASVLLQMPIRNLFLREFLLIFRFINLFWTFVNLLPILPLDGGQLVRIVLESMFGAKAWKITLYLSFFVAVLFSVGFFLIGYYLLGIFFLIFALQAVETIRNLRNLTDADQKDVNQVGLKMAEHWIALGKIEEAKEQLRKVIAESKKGLIHTAATEYLAKISFDEKKFKEAYELLSPLEKDLSCESTYILYKSAYELHDYEKVVALSGVCFQEKQTFDVAFEAAIAHAKLLKVEPAIEWLKTLRLFQQVNLLEITQNAAFDPIRGDAKFQTFLKDI